MRVGGWCGYFCTGGLFLRSGFGSLGGGYEGRAEGIHRGEGEGWLWSLVAQKCGFQWLI